MSEVDRVMEQTGMDRTQAINHVRGRDIIRRKAMDKWMSEPEQSDEELRPHTDAERELIRLRIQSPLRAAAGQSDAALLPLFVTANEPTLF